MLPRALDLDSFILVNPAENVKLQVTLAVHFQLPSRLSTLSAEAALKAMASGNVWVSRGRGCRIDLEILQDGKPLDGVVFARLLESLGCRIRDAAPWHGLCLTLSFAMIPPPPCHVSIMIKEGITPQGSTAGPGVQTDNIGLKPPDAVLCAAFERLHVRLNFLSEEPKPLETQIHMSPTTSEPDDTMLLDTPEPPLFADRRNPEMLEEVVGNMRSLSGQIAAKFDTLRRSQSSDDKVVTTKTSLLAASGGNIRTRRPTLIGELDVNSGQRFADANETVKAWLLLHAASPYPSQEEKKALAHQTGLTRKQLNARLVRLRKTQNKWSAVSKEASEEDQMLLENHSGSIEDADDEDEEMLFSQSSVNTSSLQSEISNQSSIWSVPSMLDMYHGAMGASKSLLEPIFPKLLDAAFCSLFGGYIPCNSSNTEAIHYAKPPPRTHMSRLVPTMFSPGFKESMASNAQYLPTISHAISASWPRNVQSPNLRRKLMQIQDLVDSIDITRSPNTWAGDRLPAVVQARLWGMMHNKLYDTSAARKLWRLSLESHPQDEDAEFEDLFETYGEDENQKTSEDRPEDLSDDELLFSDEDDDPLLDDNDYADKERRDTEQETDEMLFGSEWDDLEDGASDMLFSDEGEVDSMLL